MQEVRDRITTLEVKQAEQFKQTIELMGRIEGTQERIAESVNSLVEHQNRMVYLGGKVDSQSQQLKEQHDDIQELKTKQGIMWKALGVIGTALTTVIVAAAFKMYGGS